MSTSVPPPDVPSEASPSSRARSLTIVGQYDLLLELASGGMAVVYLGRARDGRSSAPLVAIKRPHRHLATDKNFLAMLLDEARLASAVTHENVVKVRELQFHEGEPFIVMDYVEGASLSELRKELVAVGRAFEPKVALRIVLDALAGLHAAHELCDADGKHLGIVHRDISPHNVLVGSDGKARLTDFGIAQAADRLQVTRTHEVKGKLAYLAPERVDRRRICTRQSDVFSMGIVLWECLAGRRLFRGDQPVDTLQEVMHAPIPRLRRIGLEIDPALDEVIARALSRDLSERYTTALEFSRAIEKTAGHGPAAAKPQVAQLVVTLYRQRIAERLDKVGQALGDQAAAERLFAEAGFARPETRAPSSTASTVDALRSIAPPAPSARYLVGEVAADFRQIEELRTRKKLVAGIALGVVIGAAGALAMARSHVSPAPVVQRGAPSVAPPRPSAPGVAALPPGRPSDLASMAATRHLAIRLPFLASRATLDGVAHDVAPASDTLSVDIPADAPMTHQIVATALDGSLAQAEVHEQDGIGMPTATGFALSPHRTSSSSSAAPPRVGVVRNGFTKLR